MKKEVLVIDLIKDTKWGWAKTFGVVMMGFCFITLISFCFFLAYSFLKENLIIGAIVSIIPIYLLYLLKKFLGNNFFKEKIVVSQNELKIIITSIVGRKKQLILLKEIEYFGPISPDFVTDSITPFAETYVYDTTGINTYHVRKELVENPCSEIRTAKDKIRFGQNIIYWRIDEAVRKVELHTGLLFKH